MNTGKENFRSKKNFAQPQKNVGRNSTIESHGPDGKIRGNAQQLIDRYTLLGKDALRESDIVLAESYFQHAEHYRRLFGVMRKTEAVSEVNKSAPQPEDNISLDQEFIVLAPPLAPSLAEEESFEQENPHLFSE